MQSSCCTEQWELIAPHDNGKSSISRCVCLIIFHSFQIVPIKHNSQGPNQPPSPSHSLALPYDPKLEKAYIICFYQEYGVALESKMHKGIPHISSGDAQQKRQIAWDQLSHRPQRQARSPRLGTYAEGSQSSKGRMQGPCRVPRRNHMGLPGINARLSSRSRGPTITDESQRNLCCYC